MKNKITITIGVPSYNEEANIRFLLEDVLRQEVKVGIIEQILIISDGSTDKTAQEISKVKSQKIKLIENSERQGLAKAQNKIINGTESDVLVILNADIRLEGIHTLEKIISPIIDSDIDLVAPSVTEAEPDTFFEKILYISTKIKNVAYEEYNKGKNVYTCRGLARGFSKRLYKKIVFTSSIGEDAFSYFYCVSNGFRYKYVRKVNILYKLPTNFADHQKQSIRFFQSQKLLETSFDKKFIKLEYAIPKSLLIKSVLKVFLKFPIHTVFYLGLVFYLKLKSPLVKKIGDTWAISKSSKELIN